MRWEPGHIEIMVQAFLGQQVIVRDERLVGQLIDEGLLEIDRFHSDRKIIADKGKAFVALLCNTEIPRPVTDWKDKDGQIIERF